MKKPTPKLIILRGPSGSGKTTVAKILFSKANERTALIEQDYYRFIFNPPGGGTKPNSITIRKMIKHNVVAALNDGYDVILEGILSVKSYSEMLEEIFEAHPANNHIFYFDVSFPETVRRHETKPVELREGFGAEEMKEWYPNAHKSGHELEQIIDEDLSVEETVKFIIDKTEIAYES